MLRLWRDRVRIALCPDKVALVRLTGGARAHVMAKEVVPCSSAAGDTRWEPSLAALRGALQREEWGDAGATVILSNHFMRYLLVPWDDKLVTDEERSAMVRHTFARAYGDAADEWEFRWSESRPGAPYVASAVDRALVDGLRETCKASSLRLRSMQPYLMAAFNHWRREMRNQTLWFLLVEPGRLCIGWFNEGEWRNLYTQRIGEAWGEELPLILDRVILGDEGVIPGKVYVHAPEQPDVALPVGDGWSVRRLALRTLPGFSPGTDAPYAMAMSV